MAQGRAVLNISLTALSAVLFLQLFYHINGVPSAQEIFVSRGSALGGIVSILAIVLSASAVRTVEDLLASFLMISAACGSAHVFSGITGVEDVHGVLGLVLSALAFIAFSGGVRLACWLSLALLAGALQGHLLGALIFSGEPASLAIAADDQALGPDRPLSPYAFLFWLCALMTLTISWVLAGDALRPGYVKLIAGGAGLSSLALSLSVFL